MPPACDRAIEAAVAAFGRLDILVNSAGVVARGSALDVRVRGCAARAPRQSRSASSRWRARPAAIFVAQGSGAVVNVASLLSFQGGVLVSSYATAKHGVVGLTRALANEWAPHGVRVNAIAPGYIATDLNERLREDPGATRRSPIASPPVAGARRETSRAHSSISARRPART